MSQDWVVDNSLREDFGSRCPMDPGMSISIAGDEPDSAYV